MGIDEFGGAGLSHSPASATHTFMRQISAFLQRQCQVAAVGVLAGATACSPQSAPLSSLTTNTVGKEHYSVTQLAASRPQVQKAVVDYLEKTVNALPIGSYLDGGAMPVGGRTMACAGANAASPTVRFEVSMAVMTSPQMQANQIASRTQALWRSWGAQVNEDPSAAGWSADTAGYRLHIAADPGAPQPTVSVASICFPDDPVLRDLPFPGIISHSA